MKTKATPPSPRRNGEHRGDLTTLAIASPRPQVLHALFARLARANDLIVTGNPVRQAARLFAFLEKRLPTLLIVDERTLDQLGPESARIIRLRFPELRVLLLCDHPDSRLFREIVRNRFHGFLRIDSAPGTCLKAIRAVTRGELWIPRAFLERAIFAHPQQNVREDVMAGLEAGLTRREAQAVKYVSRGFTNKQIAGSLGIKEDTVKKHLTSVYAKVGVRRRTELMALRTFLYPVNA